MLKRLLSSLEHPKERTVIVATQPDPLTKADLAGYADHVVLSNAIESYISQWWNLGLYYISIHAKVWHEVLAVSSDYVGMPHSVAVLAAFLRQNNLTMVGPNHHSNKAKFFRLGDHRSAVDRVQGGCWMLAGESRLRVDEHFRWWYSDDDFEMQARRHGGTGVMPGTGLEPGPDSELDEKKHSWAIEDRRKFVAKWGMEPW
jgi:hypothetical protein